ncbi:MAG: 3-dehydroquinate synthase [Alphaproteobacteria bacterium]
MDKNIVETRVNLKKDSYDIKIGHNLLKKTGDLLKPIIGKRKTFIISDERVAPIYLDVLEKSLEKSGIEYASFILPSGEKIKSFFWLEKICETLLGGRINRSSIILALGGGVIGDLAGFTASIILRGIDFVQIPTTLLSQVDSSVGGKTAINAEFGKNLIGSFYQPKMVIADLASLKTLDKRQIKSGYAEMAKYGLIQNKAFWKYLKENGKQITRLNKEKLQYAVLESCKIKAKIVAKDEKENNIRALLNFGHSFGHALEGIVDFNDKKLLHGEAVGIGMLMATMLSEKLGFAPKGTFDEIKQHFDELELFTKISDIPYFEKVTASQIIDFMERDKKNKDGKINLVLLKNIGNAFTYAEASIDDISSIINHFI